jgi:cytochrome d ubiquinol oxidase subunit II
MFAVLVPLILRPVAFKFRSKRESAAWRNGWDWVLCITGLVPALLFGVAVGNVILGVPFRLGDDMRIYYDGSFFGLLTPFALLCGLVSLSMLLMHGASWLVFKTEGEVARRAARYGMLFAC